MHISYFITIVIADSVSLDSLVSMIMDYMLDDLGSIPGSARDCSLLHGFQTSFGAHPGFYVIGT
jgi:hypothetical protein